MFKLFATLCFVTLVLYVVAAEESKNEGAEDSKSENNREGFDSNDNKKPVASDSMYMKQNMEAPTGYVPLYYEYVPFYELIGYEV